MRLNLSRFRFGYFLWILFILFGSLYLYEVAVANTFLRDLWANLLAAMIAVLLIDRIVKETELRKSERSIRYVKGKVAGIFSTLVFSMRVPSDWRARLGRSGSNWNDYYERVSASRNEALDGLENVLDSHSYLLDAVLRNDVFVTVSLLSSFTWFLVESGSERDLWKLYDAASLAVAIINQSTEAIKSHKLLKSTGYSMHFKEGEPPVLEFGKSGIVEKTQYSYYNEWLKEAIEFRDACHRAMMATGNMREKKGS